MTTRTAAGSRFLSANAFLQACVSLSLLAPACLAAPSKAAPKPRVIKWIVAHDRGNSFFTGLLDRFAADVAKKSEGALKVEYLPSQASDTSLDDDAYQKVIEGAADMSQLDASRAGVPVFQAPMLFRNYDHAEVVFEGPVGKKLLNGVATDSQGRLEGLAFAYSGGYRILVGSRAVRRLSDLKGARVRRNAGPARFLGELGANLVDLGPENRERPIEGILQGKLDLEETEVNRLAIVGKDHPEFLKRLSYINLTRHRMYVTAIVANVKFLKSLPEAQRLMLEREIKNLSAWERKLSVDLEANNIKTLQSGGAKIVTLPDSERAKLAQVAKKFLREFPELAASVKEIQAVPDTRLARQ
ncbi:MAG: TRAP transporter substrate-binding protein DctP [Elusimicrobia bacterium]|nr:TRAP transporter substrate-binding protein DctP [Elusimicrobiota bacterium]MDE2512148.1 TRAP transporter substrate-binding protein DctP [Elusimicrobiota bacterium]